MDNQRWGTASCRYLCPASPRRGGTRGLQANDYQLAKINTLLTEIRSGAGATKPIPADTLVDLDFLLTEVFLRYGADASLGDVNLDSLNEKWFEKNGEADLVLALQDALLTDTIEATLKSFPPQQEGYRKLREVFTQYQTIASQGGWATVPAGVTWQFGDRGEGVAKLQARLRASGDLAAASPSMAAPVHTASSKKQGAISVTKEEAVFDEATEQAVENFQRRHNLSVNGVVNKETLSALNVSADIRTRQIARNLERWRRLPKDLGNRHIAVNVPDFMLEVVENDRPVMDMKVVVGKIMQKRTTPTFSASMKYIVLNPYWNVPKTIAEKELLPLSRRNPAYFARNKFTIRRIPIGVKQVPDPNATDGSLIPVQTYEYLLRQGPGPKNALGRVKFMFPNDHSVYLHDTPSKDLFNRTVRAFSHGCIRIEKPIDLAEYLLQGTPKGSRDAILATFKRNKEQTVWLPEPVPVHIQYWTAWVADDGSLQFRNDIYGYDRLPGTRRLPANIVPKSRPKIRKKPAAATTNPTAPTTVRHSATTGTSSSSPNRSAHNDVRPGRLSVEYRPLPTAGACMGKKWWYRCGLQTQVLLAILCLTLYVFAAPLKTEAARKGKPGAIAKKHKSQPATLTSVRSQTKTNKAGKQYNRRSGKNARVQPPKPRPYSPPPSPGIPPSPPRQPVVRLQQKANVRQLLRRRPNWRLQS